MSNVRYYCVILRRREDVGREEFLRAWLGDHRALAVQLPGVVSVEFMPTTDEVQSADGVGILTFSSAADLEQALASDMAARLRTHTATFADSVAATRLVLTVGEKSDS